VGDLVIKDGKHGKFITCNKFLERDFKPPKAVKKTATKAYFLAAGFPSGGIAYSFGIFWQ
jgi:DNA helicase-4